MGSAPSGYQTPKTNWAAGDIPTAQDFNRIENNIRAIDEGSRTIEPTQVPSGNTGTLRQLLDWFANRIKAILGTTNWYDSPPTTLQAAKSHINAAAPHSGHETPSGAQAKADAALAAAKGYTDQEIAKVANDLASHKNETAQNHVHGLSPERVRAIYVSPNDPDDEIGEDGDIWIKYEE